MKASEIYPFGPRAAAEAWSDFARGFRDSGDSFPALCDAPFDALRRGTVDDLLVIGQLGQSLDGRVATESGQSKYINGPEALKHLHRLRSLVDAVVVGVGTALADDPRLTVRLVEGPHPARVVLDPNGRLSESARVFVNDGVRRLLIVAEGTNRSVNSGVEVQRLPANNGRIAPRVILGALAERGWRRILIEGGADTLSGFLSAGLLDRLHVMVAPMIFGSGRPSFILPPVDHVDHALRAPTRTFLLGSDVLFDVDLSAQRVSLGRANRST